VRAKDREIKSKRRRDRDMLIEDRRNKCMRVMVRKTTKERKR